MNATELKFLVPLHTQGHATIRVELFPTMQGRPAYIRAGDDKRPETCRQCELPTLSAAVQCVRQILHEIELCHGRLDYATTEQREDDIHRCALAIFFASQTLPTA